MVRAAPETRRGAVRAALLELSGRAAVDPHFAARAPAGHRRCPPTAGSAGCDVRRPRRRRLAPAATEALGLLRTELVPDTVGRLPGAEVAVTGDTAASATSPRSLSDRLPLVVGFVLGADVPVLVLWTFRSVVVAATALVLNLLSVGAAYGLLVLVFQHSWAEGLLGFRSTGAIVAWLPLFLFVVLFGLSMDYHVFVVSRIRELAVRGLPTRDAVRQGIASARPAW